MKISMECNIIMFERTHRQDISANLLLIIFLLVCIIWLENAYCSCQWHRNSSSPLGIVNNGLCSVYLLTSWVYHNKSLLGHLWSMSGIPGNNVSLPTDIPGRLCTSKAHGLKPKESGVINSRCGTILPQYHSSPPKPVHHHIEACYQMGKSCYCWDLLRHPVTMIGLNDSCKTGDLAKCLSVLWSETVSYSRVLA